MYATPTIIATETSSTPPLVSPINNVEGTIIAILGPTACGKTTRLKEYAVQHIASRLRVCCVAPRFENDAAAAAWLAASTPVEIHSQTVGSLDSLVFTPISTITELYPLANSFDTLIVDDAHFLSDFSTGALSLARLGKSIIFSGLNNTIDGTTWPSLARVSNCSDRYEHMSCLCANCAQRNACFSYRIVGTQPDYRPLCRACYRYMRAQESPIVASPGPGSPQRKLSSGIAKN